jgi:pseudouridine-5'-phosphate glycosidase
MEPLAIIRRASPVHVGVETTVLVHGVPRGEGPALARDLASIARDAGSAAAFIGVVRGKPTVGMSDDELADFFAADRVAKANTANLGLFIHRRQHAATTVSTTLELAALAGLRVCATGGLGGVHPALSRRLDISADLPALARHPVALVTSGCKSILDIPSTRELLETLGVPVVGFRTDSFPAFYLRDGGAGVDARFDDESDLASFLRAELARTGRGVVVANPIPTDAEVPRSDWDRWLAAAHAAVGPGAEGRDVTPRLLAEIHRASAGASVVAHVALIRSNTTQASRLARELGQPGR